VRRHAIDCTKCGFIVCVCEVKADHATDCRYRRAVECPVGIECEHGRDVCPDCDPCNCGQAAAHYGRHQAAESPRSMTGTAVFSPCGRYRYHLTREWDATKGRALFVMLNPSTADAEVLDPTVRRCVGYAQAWGWGSLEVVNLFAWRATDPDELTREQRRHSVAHVVGPDNDAAIGRAIARADLVMLAYGKDGALFGRAREVLRLFGSERNFFCLGKTKGGHPLHPLYLSKDLKPVPYLKPFPGTMAGEV
jgi:hypothetical protein